jgi:hypothetical protein
MSVNYISKVGVGVLEEEITYTSLTEHGKNIVLDIITDYDLEVDEEDLPDWFSENIGEYDLWYYLGLESNTGNYFSGQTGYRGVDVDLNNPEPYKEEFRKVVNLEPKIFNGVLVY